MTVVDPPLKMDISTTLIESDHHSSTIAYLKCLDKTSDEQIMIGDRQQVESGANNDLRAAEKSGSMQENK